MKKVLQKSAMTVALVLSILVTSGSSSIVAKAAEGFQVATSIGFKGEFEYASFRYTTGSQGYYKLHASCTENGKTRALGTTENMTYKANTSYSRTDNTITYNYDYLGKYTLYVIGSEKKINDSYKTVAAFEKDSSCHIASASVDVKSRMPAPKNVQVKTIMKNDRKYYRVSWDKDGYCHGVEASTLPKNIYLPAAASVDIIAPDGTCTIKVKTITDDHSVHANSVATTLTAVNNDKKTETVEVEKKVTETKLPETITVNGITYKLGADNTASVTAITGIKSATIDQITLDGVTYRVTSIAPSACEGNRKIKTLSIASSVENIDAKAFYNCKKLKDIKIKANKSLTIGDSAFKKINKKATIKVSGVKGKAKKALLKEIKKQSSGSKNKK
ncbi:MAG: leucine-rich repeat domain-containing protein [Butyrivibrio sp.]|nr:leucine-rich repeat domain-containing protein [Butyrivibrio sp.]